MADTSHAARGRAVACACVLAIGAAAPGARAAEGKKDDAERPYEAIHIIQHIPFAKEGRLELAPLFGFTVNPRFTQHWAIGLSTVYHFTESFGVELNLGYARGSQTEFDKEIRNKLNLAAQTPKLSMDFFSNVGIQISPIYGKFDILGGLGHFDFYIAAGVGIAHTILDPQLEVDRNRDPIPDKKAIQLLGSAGFGARVFILDWLGFRLELRDYIFSAVEDPSTTGTGGGGGGTIVSDVFNNLLLLGQVSFLIDLK